MLGIKEGEIHYFRSRSFCLTLPKIFVGEPFCAVFQKISGFAEIYGEEGVGYQVFPSKSFCLTVPKLFVEEPFCAVFQKISGFAEIYGEEGCGIRIFRR